MTPPKPQPVELPWHVRLEARVASALGLLVAVALGAVLLVTAGVVSAQSRDRVAADLGVARTAIYALLEQRLDAAIDEADLVTQLPTFRAQLAGGLRDRAALDAMSERHRRQMEADFTIVAAADGSWLGTAGWTDASGGGRNVVRDAQHAARGGRAAGALVPDGDRLYLAVSVPARDADAVVGTLTSGYLLTDDMTRELAALARCEVALVVNGQVVATSLASGPGRDDEALRLATMAAPGLKPDVLEMAGRQYIAAVFPLMPDVPGGDAGRLLVLSDWALTQQFIDTLRTRFALAAIAALVLSLVGGVFLSRHLSRPLRDIATAAEQIAAGNLSLQLPVRGTAEAATVARAFNAMSVSLRSAHERLVHDAIHDHLTQLPNRALFRERLDRALARRVRHPKYQFAVLFVDLDRFKHVNDSLGHTAGDRLLVVFGERLAAAVRSDDVVSRLSEASSSPEPTLARLGGDEFAVLLDGIREPLDAVRVAKRVQQMAMLPLPVDGQDVFTSASIGVAVASDAHTSGEDIIRDADLAMYRAKNAGGGGYSVFDAALHDAAVRRLRLETDLRRAVEREEFRVWYQPIVALTTRQVTGVEALVRWQHPERGLVGPGEFLEVAEEVGLIAQIDEWVLKEACLQAREWLRVGTFTAQTTVSVNLSAKAFAQETLVKHVEEILRDTGCPASSLRLEITESAAIKDAARARVVLAKLRALGVRISLDDFGTGYSSLSYLQSLPLDTLKIDRSFVAGIGTDEDKGEIIKLIVGLALTLGLEIVAEGIETAAHVDHLRALGCQCGQGYFFAKPAEAGGRPAQTSGVRPAARLAG
ncbi:MAG: putative bifunctional diguanylate cyclase/phosphodiesterase [Vicinamibacterales bacterium]